MRLDAQSSNNGRSRFVESDKLLENLGIQITEKWSYTRPTAETLVQCIKFFVESCGLRTEELLEAVAKHPPLAGYSVENHIESAGALGLTKEQYGQAVAKHPPLAGLSAENHIESACALGLTKEQ
ncbi:MAG: hypothetical protein KGH67_01765 [Candidatus Micrarchaeota archaeon]|nr:hypothetical protein [Candidatus Micrarchaeota archaeon]